ncbi:uncharacterized protein LOC143028263 [Oratosquilla oratoria]|uniref:uncharacterized protein LOC143028263 n=1 Tax=Oratosquilla oratoria TaxID=337810 RepID=UPI003F7619F6
MRWVTYFFVTVAFVYITKALPVKENKGTEEKKEEEAKEEVKEGEDWELSLEYGRYLREVVQALESDQDFRKKLETADLDDIKSGKISRELHFVDHNIRTKLDELKRQELERLRHLAQKEHEKESGIDRSRLKIPTHLDYKNPTRFEVEDLKKLIVQTTKDLEEVDKQRREEFKKYEMEKEYERQQELQEMDEEHRKTAEMKHEEEVKKHKDHPNLHHPVSKQQLEQVWEEQDHLRADEFDPKTFFYLHDVDGNKMWDEIEVKALFQKELEKMYDPTNPEDDINEKYEEMERMREHVFAESDLNRDGMISLDEFMEHVKKSDFEQDQGWQGLDEQQIYSESEFHEYERQRQEEIKKLVMSGAIPPPPGYEGMHPPQPAVYQGSPYQGQPPNAVPPPHAVPVYGAPPQADSRAPPQGYQVVPQVPPQGYQAVPQGYQAVPQAPPQGYQAPPQGYQAPPQGYQAPPQGYQAVPLPPPQGNQGVPRVPDIQTGQAPVYIPPEGYRVVNAPPPGYQVVHAPPQGSQVAPQVPQGNQAASPVPSQGQKAQPLSVPSSPASAGPPQGVSTTTAAPAAAAAVSGPAVGGQVKTIVSQLPVSGQQGGTASVQMQYIPNNAPIQGAGAGLPQGQVAQQQPGGNVVPPPAVQPIAQMPQAVQPIAGQQEHAPPVQPIAMQQHLQGVAQQAQQPVAPGNPPVPQQPVVSGNVVVPQQVVNNNIPGT